MKHKDQIEFYSCPLCGMGTGNDVDGNQEHNCPIAEEMRKEEVNTTPKEEWAQKLLPNTEDHEAARLSALEGDKGNNK